MTHLERRGAFTLACIVASIAERPPNLRKAKVMYLEGAIPLAFWHILGVRPQKRAFDLNFPAASWTAAPKAFVDRSMLFVLEPAKYREIIIN